MAEDKSVESSIIKEKTETDSFDKKSYIYTHTMSVVSDGLDNNLTNREERAQGVGRVDLWLGTAELFCELKKFKEASMCLQEAKNLSSLCADIYFMEGFIEESQLRYEEATKWYEKALSIDSRHQESLTHLGTIYCEQQKYFEAEKCLTSFVRCDLTCHQAWHHLGLVLKAKGEMHKASDCFLTAIELSQTSPIVPYSKIPKTV